MLEIEVLESKKTLTFEELFKSKALELKCLWCEPKPPYSVQAWLGMDPDSLMFGIEIPLPLSFDHTLKLGTFTEGLWKLDVAELFICEAGSHRYQEFNLSPGGAWWTQVFSDYRKPLEACKEFPQPEIHCEMGSTTWRGGLKVKTASLGIEFRTSQNTKINVCAITQQPNSHYFSLANISSSKPDFHLTQQFQSIREHGRK